MKLLIMQFSPASRHFLPLRSGYSPQYPVLKHNLRSSLSVTDQVSHPYNITDKIMVLYILVLKFPQGRRKTKGSE
jgi:hypothetical protein